MKRNLLTALVLGFLMSSTTWAGNPGNNFSYNSIPNGNGGGDIFDNGIGVYTIFMNNPSIPAIASIELDINGLTTADPTDLDVYLIDPFGHTLKIMSDRGDSMPLENATLFFSDDGMSLPADPGALIPGTDYSSEVPNGFFNTFVGNSGGTDAWILLILDAGGIKGGASIESYTLHGTYVPEPATIALMGFGTLALLRRKR